MKTLTELPVISRLSANIIRILGCNPGPATLQGTNTYLVGTGTRRALIDTGEETTAEKYVKVLDQVLKEEKATIQHLICTHWHNDHIGGVKAVQNLLKSNSFAEPATVWKLRRSNEDSGKTDLEEATQFQPLTDEQLLEVEGAKLRVKYTPGHSTDHVSLMIEDENALFSGDCILGEGTSVFEDLQTYMQSLYKILDMSPSVIYPGHGPVLSDPIPSIKYYIKHRQEREIQILELLEKYAREKPISEDDIIEHLYKTLPDDLKMIAAINVWNHLVKLSKEGKAKGDKGTWQFISK